MALTYSITALLIILGITGRHVLAADVGIVQGAVLATFYVFSGDARHLILTNQVHATNVAFFRLVWLAPLAILCYFMSTTAGHVNALIGCALILRRSTEWLAEIHVTEIERLNGKWWGLFTEPIVFFLLIVQLLLTEQNWFIWIWALSPIWFSLSFFKTVTPSNPFSFAWENITSTAVMGFAGYLTRVLIVGLIGKELAGMLLPGFAVGSFVGSMAANVAGPTLFAKGLFKSKAFISGLLLWFFLGCVVFIFSASLLYKSTSFHQYLSYTTAHRHLH
jgi:hypothetical protein